MTDEELEISNAEETHIRNSGYIDKAHYERHRADVIDGLILYGDRFAMRLGYALKEANLYDSIKIMRYWAQTCDQMALMNKMLKAKEAAE